jgi:sialate O-acetylesterase
MIAKFPMNNRSGMTRRMWLAFLGWILVLAGPAQVAAQPVVVDSLPDGIERIDIYLLLGQSNMKGRGVIPAESTPDDRILNMNMADDQWYVAAHPLHAAGVPDLIDASDNAGVGPGLDFARALRAAEPGVMIGLVPCALGGSAINLWQPGRDLYQEAIRRATLALANVPPGTARLAGVLWLQGESDAVEARYALYSDRLSAVVRGLRSDLNEPDLPFVACTIGTFINPLNYPRVVEINDVLLSLPNREPRTVCVDARDIVTHIGDAMHFDTAAQVEIGQRYAVAMAALQDGGSAGGEGEVLFSTDFGAATQTVLGQAIAMGGSTAPGIEVSPLSAGAGVVVLRLDNQATSDGNFAAASVGANPSASLDAALANNEYFEFTLTADTPRAIGSVAFTMVKHGFPQAAGITLRSSLDGFVADLATVTDSAAPGVYPVSADLAATPGFEAVTAVTFRLYLYDSFTGSNNRRLGFDNLLIATPGSVPGEPVRLAPLFASGCVLQRDQPVTVWGTAQANETITVRVRLQAVTTVADSGGVWSLALQPEPAGGPHLMTVSGTSSSRVILTDVYFGDVWLLGGQSNMERSIARQLLDFPAYYAPAPNSTDNFDDMRFAIVRDTQTAVGPLASVILSHGWSRWQEDALGDLSGTGYYFARALKALFDEHPAAAVPLGFIQACKGATAIEEWIASADLAAMAEPLVAREGKPPSNYYNGMIAPIQRYAVKGVIWYQGEANTDTIERAQQYPLLFRTLVASWRAAWDNPQLPFYYVQLAPFMNFQHVPRDRIWPWMREAQAACLDVAHTGMACIIDSGLQADIHPPFKDRVGARLAQVAAAASYGLPVVARGPTLSAYHVDGSSVLLTFDNVATGLETRAVDAQPDAEEVALGRLPVSVASDELAGFQLAGADGVFYRATEAEILSPTTLRIANRANVPQPVAIRYAWDNFPRCNLYNAAGLPAEPFRTDAYAFEASSGGDSAPVVIGSLDQLVASQVGTLTIDLEGAVRDLEDGDRPLQFSVASIDNLEVVGAAHIVGGRLELTLTGTAGVARIQLLIVDSAANQVAHDLVITVAAARDYQQWRDLHFAPEDLADPALEGALWGDAADPDGDGIANLLEYLFGSDPRQAEPDQPSLQVVADGAYFVVQYPVAKRTADEPTLHHAMQWSASLMADDWAEWDTGAAPLIDLGPSVVYGVWIPRAETERLLAMRIVASWAAQP